MTESGTGPEVVTYAFKPALMRGASEFQVTSDGLDWKAASKIGEWKAGSRGGQVYFCDIFRIRLSFRPSSVQSGRYMTEIWTSLGGKLEVASTSRRTVLESDRQDGAYSTFVRALISRAAAANRGLVLEAGTLALKYWAGLVVFVVLALAIAALGIEAVWAEQWIGAAIVGAFWLVFLWQIGLYFQRNRPRLFTADTIPPELLPIERSWRKRDLGPDLGPRPPKAS